MRIVITGALGHIGSRLLHALPAQFPDLEVVIVDNMLTQRYCSLLDLPETGWFRYVRADVRTAEMRDIFEGADAVLHRFNRAEVGRMRHPDIVHVKNQHDIPGLQAEPFSKSFRARHSAGKKLDD